MKLKKISELKGSFKKIIKVQNPAQIALSVSMGIFIGIFVPAGFQTFAAVPLAMLTRSNALIVWGATYVSNPLTVIPIYIFSLDIGRFITGSSLSNGGINHLLSNPSVSSIFGFVTNSMPLILLGSFIIGIALAFISYIMVYFSINAIRIARAK